MMRNAAADIIKTNRSKDRAKSDHADFSNGKSMAGHLAHCRLFLSPSSMCSMHDRWRISGENIILELDLLSPLILPCDLATTWLAFLQTYPSDLECDCSSGLRSVKDAIIT